MTPMKQAKKKRKQNATDILPFICDKRMYHHQRQAEEECSNLVRNFCSADGVLNLITSPELDAVVSELKRHRERFGEIEVSMRSFEKEHRARPVAKEIELFEFFPSRNMLAKLVTYDMKLASVIKALDNFRRNEIPYNIEKYTDLTVSEFVVLYELGMLGQAPTQIASDFYFITGAIH